MKFLCGAAREIITPPIGTNLYGYAPDVISESVHDDLTLTAIAAGNTEETVLLISMTLGDTHTDLSDELRMAVEKNCGIPYENVLLSSTHTHCGPNTSGEIGWGEIDRKYVDSILYPALMKASKDAIASMAEAELGIASGKSDVGINRRQQMENGDVYLGQNPWACYDPEMTVMVFRRKDDKKGIINLVHYGCHGTACGKSTEITRDWSGVMIDRMEELTGVMTVFFNGAIGDVGPRISNGYTTGNMSYVIELGSIASVDAMNIYREVKAFSEPEISVMKDKVTLPYQPMLPLETVQKQIAGIKNPERLINVEMLEYQHLKDVEKILLEGKNDLPTALEYQQTLVRIGDAVFIPFPFEHFSEISVRLRAYSGMAHTLTLSCTNGYNGYLPAEDQIAIGGYEVKVFRYNSPFSLMDNTDQNIINENLRILRKEK